MAPLAIDLIVDDFVNQELWAAASVATEAGAGAVPGLLPTCVERGAEVYCAHGPLIPACA